MRKRDYRLVIRLTEDEYNWIHKESSDSDVSKSKFIRNALKEYILEKPVHLTTPGRSE